MIANDKRENEAMVSERVYQDNGCPFGSTIDMFKCMCIIKWNGEAGDGTKCNANEMKKKKMMQRRCRK